MADSKNQGIKAPIDSPSEGTSPDLDTKIDQAKWLLERTLAWIVNADAKVGVGMALNTAMVGVLASAYRESANQINTCWKFLVISLAVLGLASAIICAALAAIPRVTGPATSRIFFGRISEQSEGEFQMGFRKETEDEFLEDLLRQIHRNAQIATQKHSWVRKSITWSFISITPWVLSLWMLAKR